MEVKGRIQCPYCYEEAVKFVTVDDCRQHALEEHEEEMKEPLGSGSVSYTHLTLTTILRV